MTSHPSQSNYLLADVLAVAKLHPFYDSSIPYPPNASEIRTAREQASEEDAETAMRKQPLLWKKDLYTTIQRLVNDTSPQNTYRHSIYSSCTGGGSGSKPLFFATDVHENRRHRAYFGEYLRVTGLIKHTDWVLSVHTEGDLYRSLDLTLETMENAGASVLAGGSHMEPDAVVKLLIDYHVNVLSGDSGQIIRVVYYISTLPAEERDMIQLDKIIYTSEALTKAQRAHINKVLGPIKICSVIGSAEGGPFAISNPDLTGQDADAEYADFVYDTRLALMEIFPLSASDSDPDISVLPEGEKGIIAQTCLSRLRNPVVRYVTGDVGSIHALPERARALVPESYWPHLRVLRLQGRDRRFSFEWDGNYIEFDKLQAMMNDVEWGLLQWQVILDKFPPALIESSLEIRLLCSPRNDHLLSKEDLVEKIKHFFHACPENEYRFNIAFQDGIDGFQRNKTGGKIMKYVDCFN